MPKGGAKPGERRGGRKKGTPNKVTSAARSAFMAIFGNLEGDIETWIRRGAEGELQPLTIKGVPVIVDEKPVMVRTGADPLKAADIAVKMAEYHFPKLGRQELVGGDGGAIQVVIQKFTDDKPPEGA